MLAKVAPLFHVRKLNNLFPFIVIRLHMHLAPVDFAMDHKSFTIEIIITNVQVEKGLEQYSNLLVKVRCGDFQCIPMRIISYSLDPPVLTDA